MMTEPEAWLAFVAGARAWADHLDQLDKIKFQTPAGPVYVSISRGTNSPGSFDEVNNAGDVVAQGRKRRPVSA